MIKYRDLYNAKKQPTGKTFIKGEQIPKGYFYLIVIIIIENNKGEYLVQKRVALKGGKWALTGGHPKAGESSLEGIREEVKEELGIDIKNENLFLFKTLTHNDQFFDLYYLKKDIDLKDIKIQKEEVDGVMWTSKENIISLYQKGEFHEGHYHIFKEYLKYRGEE